MIKNAKKIWYLIVIALVVGFVFGVYIGGNPTDEMEAGRILCRTTGRTVGPGFSLSQTDTQFSTIVTSKMVLVECS